MYFAEETRSYESLTAIDFHNNIKTRLFNSNLKK